MRVGQRIRLIRSASIANSTIIDAPFFEDLNRGEVFHGVGITILESHAVLHQTLFGDRMLLPLDRQLSKRVTGDSRGLVHPNVVANIAIGQSTEATQRVKANLFYSNFLNKRPVWIGDTLSTTAEVVALRRNRLKPGRKATGLAVLKISTSNQRGEEVLSFLRCPMLPCRNGGEESAHDDNIDAHRGEPTSDELRVVCPDNWDLGALHEQSHGRKFADICAGDEFLINARDTVTQATSLVRATSNMAWTHLDAGASHTGRRLVYGGHTISMACAQVSRALPGMATIVGWQSCDHLAPVFDGDVLQTRVSVLEAVPIKRGGGLCLLHAETTASRTGGNAESVSNVLDWRFTVLTC